MQPGPQLENTLIAKSENFLLIPCIGPMVVGHAIVVSRNHHPSLASMGSNAIAEYDQFVKELTRGTTDWLEFEHGATNDNCAGACVVHTHIHLVPGLSSYVTIHALASDGAG